MNRDSRAPTVAYADTRALCPDSVTSIGGSSLASELSAVDHAGGPRDSQVEVSFAALRQTAPDRAPELAAAVQQAFYVDGLSLSEAATYRAFAQAAGLDADAVVSAFQDPEAPSTAADDFHRAAGLGVTGFPTLLAVDGDAVTHLAHGHTTADEIDIRHPYEGKLKAWAALGPNLPTRLVDLQPLTGDLTLEGHRFELKGGPAGLPDRHYLWQAEQRAVLGGVLLFQQEHVWIADTATSGDRAPWIDLLDEMASLDPELVVPGHRLPGAAADVSAITATRDYLLAFEEELAKASDGAALTEALVRRYPDHGMLIAAQIGAKVAKGEMKWG
ncbi:DsbA family protein [Streptomyces caelestis]|uniref:DsbA family protein n=1 Tax=Streptomyces caelestis TaxID=36816 RepID=UPI001C873BC2